ncbi:SMP-30/Gluconolaconase/LRE-like region domain-containing protein [Ditylenchus destructor]|nr:SMP-30/Gluconolaconase/LRE-like region domain-containing protein [Ditylenchus destructor]
MERSPISPIPTAISSGVSIPIPKPGCRSRKKVWFHHRVEDGGVDGSVVDAEGTLWNACWGGSALNAYSPQGRLIRSIKLLLASQPAPPLSAQTPLC